MKRGNLNETKQFWSTINVFCIKFNRRRNKTENKLRYRDALMGIIILILSVAVPWDMISFR